MINAQTKQPAKILHLARWGFPIVMIVVGTFGFWDKYQYLGTALAALLAICSLGLGKMLQEFMVNLKVNGPAAVGAAVCIAMSLAYEYTAVDIGFKAMSEKQIIVSDVQKTASIQLAVAKQERLNAQAIIRDFNVTPEQRAAASTKLVELAGTITGLEAVKQPEPAMSKNHIHMLSAGLSLVNLLLVWSVIERNTSPSPKNQDEQNTPQPAQKDDEPSNIIEFDLTAAQREKESKDFKQGVQKTMEKIRQQIETDESWGKHKTAKG